MVAVAALARRSRYVSEAIADLDAGTHTPKQVAIRLGISLNAVYKMRRRLERAVGHEYKRHETRGRKSGLFFYKLQ